MNKKNIIKLFNDMQDYDDKTIFAAVLLYYRDNNMRKIEDISSKKINAISKSYDMYMEDSEVRLLNEDITDIYESVINKGLKNKDREL